MKPTTFYTLVGLTVISVVAAGISVSMQTNVTTLTPGTEPAFPLLKKNINEVVKLELRNSKTSFSITRNSGNWGLDQKDGYGVEFEKVKSAIVNIANFKLIERKTSDPARYKRLEVRDPKSKNAKSKKIVLKNGQGDILAEAVIGKVNVNLFGMGGAGTYLRRYNEKETWLVRGQVTLGKEPNDWLARQIVNFGQEKVRRVKIEAPDGAGFVISKRNQKDKNFVLDSAPKNRKLKNLDELNPLGGVMWRMMFDDVKKAKRQKWPSKTWIAHYETWTGLVVRIETAKFGDDYWGRFSASVVKDISDKHRKAADKLAQSISSKTKGWSYLLTAGDSEKLISKVTDYLSPVRKKDSKK